MKEVLLFVFGVLIIVFLWANLFGLEQGDRDARRLDVIEQRLGIPGPDVSTPTIQDLMATIQAERTQK